MLISNKHIFPNSIFSTNIVQEPADVYITSRVQKVWVVRCANGPLEITQWWFLSFPLRAFGLGMRLKWSPNVSMRAKHI